MEKKKTSLAEALCKAQLELANPAKDGKAYKGDYLTLSGLIEETKPTLAKHGLSIVQFPGKCAEGFIELQTILIHSSGETLESTMSVPCTDTEKDGETGEIRIVLTPQTVGSAISYARRYAWQAVIGVAATDAENVTRETSSTKATASTTVPTGERFKAIITAGAVHGWQPQTLTRALTAMVGHQDLEKLSAKQFTWLASSAARDTPESFIEFVEANKKQSA